MGRVFLPYIKGVTDKIAKVLRKNDIFAQFLASGTIRQRMRSVKDGINLNNLKECTRLTVHARKFISVRLSVHFRKDLRSMEPISGMNDHTPQPLHNTPLKPNIKYVWKMQQ